MFKKAATTLLSTSRPSRSSRSPPIVISTLSHHVKPSLFLTSRIRSRNQSSSPSTYAPPYYQPSPGSAQPLPQYSPYHPPQYHPQSPPPPPPPNFPGYNANNTNNDGGSSKFSFDDICQPRHGAFWITLAAGFSGLCIWAYLQETTDEHVAMILENLHPDLPPQHILNHLDALNTSMNNWFFQELFRWHGGLDVLQPLLNHEEKSIRLMTLQLLVQATENPWIADEVSKSPMMNRIFSFALKNEKAEAYLSCAILTRLCRIDAVQERFLNHLTAFPIMMQTNDPYVLRSLSIIMAHLFANENLCRKLERTQYVSLARRLFETTEDSETKKFASISMRAVNRNIAGGESASSLLSQFEQQMLAIEGFKKMFAFGASGFLYSFLRYWMKAEGAARLQMPRVPFGGILKRAGLVSLASMSLCSLDLWMELWSATQRKEQNKLYTVAVKAGTGAAAARSALRKELIGEDSLEEPQQRQYEDLSEQEEEVVKVSESVEKAGLAVTCLSSTLCVVLMLRARIPFLVFPYLFAESLMSDSSWVNSAFSSVTNIATRSDSDSDE